MAKHGDKHIITGTGIVLWDGVTRPDTNDNGDEVWSLKVAFPANQPEVAELQELATSEFQSGLHKGNWPANGIWPLSDAQPDEFGGAINGHVVCNIKSYRGAPDVFDINRNKLNPMTYNNMLYPGARVAVLLHAYSYNKKSKGIGFGLDGIQIVDATAERLPGIGGVDASKAFGAAAPGGPAMPGAAPGGPAMPGAAPGGPAVPGAAPGGPAVPGAAPGGPAVPGAAPVAPNHGFLNPGQAQGATPPPAAQKVMTAAANGVTYEAYIAANWTDEMLISNGLMVLQ